ncbi:MAG: serine/threonine protein kinase [bacterium]|nr:serine/threonine protein kinase [bacterium]
MAPDDRRWKRADEIFDAALDLPDEQRGSFVERECGGDSELRGQVVRLLELVDDAAPLPGDPLTDPSLWALDDADESPDAWIGKTVGRFRIERELGRGGMAVVYLAQRADGEFRQDVALKLIKRGTDTDEALRRFAQERQIMAGIAHPNIASLIDGGTTDDGRPYFVMEHVEGRSIDRWCNEQRLPVRERLKLYLQVAEALAYAHRNLVIHRDIKPSNILVTDDGVVKLLDFGIARYLDPEGDVPDRTATQKRFLTPTWASPEQLGGAHVTTASDVYQLGLLLYLLLSGRSPHGSDTGDSEALRRSVLEGTFTRPSAAVALATEEDGTEDVGRDRGTSAKLLRRELSGDLDNIVLKALSRQPERRYSSVAQLVEDIERFLRGLPVSARPDSLTYRVGKLVARYKLAAGFAGLALVLLLAFAVTMTVQANKIAAERDRANLEAEVSRRVSDFLVGLFRVSNPGEVGGESITARELLDEGAKKISGDLADQPELQARLMDTMGVVYQQLGLYDDAEPLMEQAVSVRREHLDADHPDMLASMNHIGALYFHQGRYDEAETVCRDTLERQRRVLGDEHVETLRTMNVLANIHQNRGRYSEAQPIYRTIIEARQRVLGPDHIETLSAMHNLGAALFRMGQLDEAQLMFADVTEIRARTLGFDHPETLATRSSLANVLQRQGKLEEAEPQYLRVLELRRRVHGADHPNTLTTMHNLAALYKNQGRYDEAIPIYLDTLAAQKRVYGDEHIKTLRTMNSLADVYTNQGRHDEAGPLFAEVIARQKRVLGENHPEMAITMHNLACVYRETGRLEESRRLFEESQRILESQLDSKHPWIAATAADYAKLLRQIGDDERAETYEARARGE